MMPLTSAGPFGSHVTDPPWEAKDQLPGPGRGASKKYKVMSTAAICTMPTPIMLPDSVLYIWRIGAMVPDAYRVAQAWGFEGKAEIVWRKMRRCGPCNGTGKRRTGGRGATTIVTSCEACEGRGRIRHFGMGHHVRYVHESCIIATRGSPKRLAANIESEFEALMPEDDGELIHSAKPREFYDIVERLYPGPYVETFSRTNRDNWVTLGDQVPDVLRDRSGAKMRGLSRALTGGA